MSIKLHFSVGPLWNSYRVGVILKYAGTMALIFTPRRIASAVLAAAILCVHLSVRPTHAGIVSKRWHVAWCSLHRQFQATGQPVSRAQGLFDYRIRIHNESEPKVNPTHTTHA